MVLTKVDLRLFLASVSHLLASLVFCWSKKIKRCATSLAAFWQVLWLLDGSAPLRGREWVKF
jgi:hypothetical protein